MEKEKFKDVELEGRRWRINRFDALTGNALAAKLMSKLAHVAVSLVSSGVKDAAIVATAISSELGVFEPEEFIYIQSTCLRYCSEVTELNKQEICLPVMRPDGRWGVENVSDDMLLVMGLTAHAVAFNLLPFFAENALKKMATSFKMYAGYLPRLSAETSTDSSMPQS